MTKGGVTVKVLTGRAAAPLQRYRDSVDDGQEPYLYSATRHCSHDSYKQIAEWRAVREEHKTQGARRAARAKYESVDPETGLHATGERGTHVRYHDGKRWRKRPVRPGETPTHLRIEPTSRVAVKESEATHTIYAFGADMVNAESPDDTQRAFEAVVAQRAEQYPGLQESIWGERNGNSGLFHVHVASNATIYDDFTLDGVDYRAGQKMGGDLTKVDSVRRRFEQYLDAHPEHEMEQSLARVGTAEYDAAQLRDGQATYWEKTRGKQTAQERIRESAQESLGDQGVDTRDAFIAAMKARGVTVTETGLRRGKPGKSHDYAYRVKGGKRTVKGATLGPDYSYKAIGKHLGDKAKGKTLALSSLVIRQPRPLPFQQRPLPADEAAALAQLRADVEKLAEAQRARQQEAAAQSAPAVEPEMDKGLAAEDDHQLAQPEPVAEQSERDGVDVSADDEQVIEAETQTSDAPADAAPETHRTKFQRQRFVIAMSESEPEDEAAPEQQQSDERAVAAESAQDTPAKPREAMSLVRFSPGNRHYVLVQDAGITHESGARALDVQLDARDPAAAGQRGLHLGLRGSRVWYSAADFERIKEAAGDNVCRGVGGGGRELRVYGVRGVVKPAGRGPGYVVQAKRYDRKSDSERNALTPGHPVGADWLDRQRASEDKARREAPSLGGDRGASSVIGRSHARAAEKPQRSIVD